MRTFTKIDTVLTHVDSGANSFVFTNRKLFWKYQDIESSVRMGDGRKVTAIGIGIVLIRLQNIPNPLPLYPCYHMPQNPQNSFSPPAFKAYTPDIKHTRYEALEWIRFTTISGKACRIPTITKYHQKENQDYINIDIIKPISLSQDPHTPSLPSTITSKITPPLQKSTTPQKTSSSPQTIKPPQLNHSFSKNDNPDWTIIHRRLDHIKDKALLTMCKNKTIEGLPQRFSSKFHRHKQDCLICSQASLENVPRGITINTNNLRPGQLLHMDFYYMNELSIRHFTCVLLIIDAKTRKLWQFPTPNKRPPLDIINFFLTQLKNNGRQPQHIRTDLGGELAKSAEFCELLVAKYQCAIQTTGGYSSWLNGKAERHIKTSRNMIRAGLFDSGLPKSLWCFRVEDSTEKYNALYHTAIDDSPHYLWYNQRPHISNFRVWGCYIEAHLPPSKSLETLTEPGYYMGITSTKAVIRYWHPNKKSIGYCTTARFYEHNSILPNGKLSSGSHLSQGLPLTDEIINKTEVLTLDYRNHPLLESPPETIRLRLPPKGTSIGLHIKTCPYHNLPYIFKSDITSAYHKKVKKANKRNVWILAIGNNAPITPTQVMNDLKAFQIDEKQSPPITIIIAKRGNDDTISKLQQYWTASNQMKLVPQTIIDSEAIDIPTQQKSSNKPSKQTTTATLRRSKRIRMQNPQLKRIFQAPIRPEKPLHIGDAMESPIRPEWLEALFDCYDKMHRTGTLSRPFQRKLLPQDTKFINPRLTFEVRITDLPTFFELKVRLCADGSRMVMGLDYDLSFAPVIDSPSLHFMIAIATSEGMTFYFIDISNAFQTNVIADPKRRHYIKLPALYLKWFKSIWPNHPIVQMDPKELCMQTLRGLQGTKDAGRLWYELIYTILVDGLGMIPCSTNKGLFTWNKNNHRALLALATDDIIFASTDESLWNILQSTFQQYFDYTTRTGPELAFLNFRIIQSEHGTSIDQTNHIQQTILNKYFTTDKRVPFYSSPFPLDSKFEIELFESLPLSENDLTKIEERYNGTYCFYIGAIQHVANYSRPDLEYAIMRLSGYNANPTLACFKALHQLLCYLHHHPHIPTMFPRKPITRETPLRSHFGTGDAEITDIDYEQYTSLKCSTDSDLARDTLTRRSATGSIHEYN